MQVDQAGRDDASGDVPHRGAAGVEAGGDRCDSTVGETHVHDAIDLLGRIDDAAVTEHEVKRHLESIAGWNPEVDAVGLVVQDARRTPVSRSKTCRQLPGADRVSGAPGLRPVGSAQVALIIIGPTWTSR